MFEQDLTEAEVAANEAIARQRDIDAHSVQKPLDYSNKIQGMGNRFDTEPERRPNVERLSGQLDYDDSTFAAAVVDARSIPELPDGEFEALLDGMIAKGDLQGFRREINIEIARSKGGTHKLIKSVRAVMTGLRPFDENSKECLLMIKEMVISGRHYELPEHYELPAEQKKVTEPLK